MKAVKRAVVRGLAVLATASLAALSPANAGAEQYVAIGTAKASGSWYPLGAAMSQTISRHAKGVSASVEATKGGIANVRLLARGEVDAAFVPSWSIAEAFKGEGSYKGTAGFPAKVAGWFAFAPNYLTIMVPADSTLKSVRDFKGKRINLGAPGTFNRPILQMVLTQYGIGTDDVEGLNLAVGPSTDRLKDRQIDAVWWWAAVPTAAFTDASVSIATRLLPLEQDMIQKLVEAYPWFNAGSIPAGAYKGSENPTATVKTKISVALHQRLSDDVVYAMTKAVFENLEELRQIHPVFKDLSKDNALEGLSIPLHPGALRYYKEKDYPGVDAYVEKFGKL